MFILATSPHSNQAPEFSGVREREGGDASKIPPVFSNMCVGTCNRGETRELPLGSLSGRHPRVLLPF